MFNLSRVFSIFKKELKFTLRDPDLILTIFLLPMIIYPIMAIGGAIFLSQAHSRVLKAEVKVVLPDSFEQFAKILATESLALSFVADPRSSLDALKEGKIDAVVEVATPAADFAQADSSQSAGLMVKYDSTRWRSDKASDIIYDQLAEVREHLRDGRLKSKNLDSDFYYPFRIDHENVARPAKMGGFMVGNILPMVIIMFSLLCGFYSAIDLTTGEKERGTLETLLLSPIPFNEIILGKFLTVVAIILLSVAVNLFFLGGTFKVGLYQMGKMVAKSLVVETSFKAIFLMFLIMMPFAATIAGIMMAISFMSKSVKEAQSYLAPCISLLLVPAVSGAIPGVDLTPFTASIPIVNISLTLKAFFVGEWTVALYLHAFIACVVHSLVILALASTLFRSEEIFDRGSSEFSHLFHRVSPDKTEPTARAAVMIFGMVAALAFFLGETLQNNPRWNLITGLAMLQLVVVLGPPLAYLLFYRYRLAPTLNLEFKAIRPGNFFVIPIMSICVLIWVMQYGLVQNHFFPAPNELNELFLGFFDVAPVWYIFLVGSLMAGFCEEVLFRGVILKGLKSRLGKRWALFLTAAMFGVFHITPYKMVSTALIGLWLGFVALRTASLWSSIFAHAFNNAVALAAVYAFHLADNGNINAGKSLMLPLPLLIGAALVFLLLVPRLKSPELVQAPSVCGSAPESDL